MHKNKTSRLAGLALCSSLTVASGNALATQVDVYDFNNLNPGYLDGQDNWAAAGVSIPNHPLYPPLVLTNGFDGSNFVGRTVQHGNTYSTGTRVNDDNFSFDLSGASGGIVEIDQQVAYWGIHFGLGNDSNQNGFLEEEERAVQFFVASRLGTAKLNDETVTSALPGISYNDWVTFQLVMDFNDNSGDGSASLLSMNLTDGESVFTAISGLQDISLGLNSLGTDQQPDDWNAMWFHIEADPAGIDNIRITSVPEPGSLALIGLGMLGIGYRNLQRKTTS